MRHFFSVILLQNKLPQTTICSPFCSSSRDPWEHPPGPCDVGWDGSHGWVAPEALLKGVAAQLGAGGPLSVQVGPNLSHKVAEDCKRMSAKAAGLVRPRVGAGAVSHP